MASRTSSQVLKFDIQRSVILSEYIKYWGMPEYRQIMAKGNELIELYTFPGNNKEHVTRFATIGLSSNQPKDSTNDCSIELFLVVPQCVAYEQTEQIKNYLFDVVAYLKNTLKINPKVGTTIPESLLAPDNWPKALLFDEPLGEPQELTNFHVGNQHIDLLWLIPIYGSEYDIIKKMGLSKFDKLEQQGSISLVDIRREPITFIIPEVSQLEKNE